MQDLESMPNPDVNTPDVDIDNGRNTDVEQLDNSNETIPVPPDKTPSVPVEDQPDAREKTPIGDPDKNEPEQIA